ncbi:MAG: hypothetical protein N2485_05170 [bacterium]|nr:hypothetical protein [bacterium]
MDANTKLSIIKTLSDLNKNGITFIYITHDIGTLKYFEGRIAVMYKGELVEVGNLKESLDNPLHTYLKLLLNKDDYNINENKSGVLESEDNINSNNFRACVFYFRCKYAANKCKVEKPLLKIHQSRFVACHLFNDYQ